MKKKITPSTHVKINQSKIAMYLLKIPQVSTKKQTAKQKKKKKVKQTKEY